MTASNATLRFRPAEPSDALLHARIYTESSPEEPVSVQTVLDAWAAAPSAERYTILLDEQPVGLAGIALEEAGAGGLRAARLEGDLIGPQRSHLHLGLAYDFVEERARTLGTNHFVTHARESDDILILNLRRRGYGGKRVFAWWEASLSGREAELRAAAAEAIAGLGGGLTVEPAPDGPPGLSWVARRDGLVSAGALVSGEPCAWLELAQEGADPALVAALELHVLAACAGAGLPLIRTERPDESRSFEGPAGWRRLPGMIEFHVSVEERDRRLANPRI